MADDPRDILQKLIETCRDGETGYLHAAGVAEDLELKSYFQQQSRQRARFRAELTDAVTRLGERDPIRAVALRLCFTERGSKPKKISNHAR